MAFTFSRLACCGSHGQNAERQWRLVQRLCIFNKLFSGATGRTPKGNGDALTILSMASGSRSREPRAERRKAMETLMSIASVTLPFSWEPRAERRKAMETHEVCVCWELNTTREPRAERRKAMETLISYLLIQQSPSWEPRAERRKAMETPRRIFNNDSIFNREPRAERRKAMETLNYSLA